MRRIDLKSSGERLKMRQFLMRTQMYVIFHLLNRLLCSPLAARGGCWLVLVEQQFLYQELGCTVVLC